MVSLAVTYVLYKHREKTNVKEQRVKSPTKANTDHHNGDMKRNIP